MLILFMKCLLSPSTSLSTFHTLSHLILPTLLRYYYFHLEARKWHKLCSDLTARVAEPIFKAQRCDARTYIFHHYTKLPLTGLSSDRQMSPFQLPHFSKVEVNHMSLWGTHPLLVPEVAGNMVLASLLRLLQGNSTRQPSSCPRSRDSSAQTVREVGEAT